MKMRANGQFFLKPFILALSLILIVDAVVLPTE